MSEEKKFTIGQFEFENYYEYREALEDVKKIELINEELNVQDPEVAIRLYNDIRDGIIKFNTPLGQQFADHVGDIVAEKSVGLLDDRAVIQEAEGQVKNQKVVGFFCIAAAIVVFGIYAFMEIKDIYRTRQVAQMQQSMTTERESDSDRQETLPADNEPETEYSGPASTEGMQVSWPDIDRGNLVVAEKFNDLLAQNSDLVGWISIIDGDVNYPVLQTKDDPEFYLRRDFNKKENTAGSIFMDYRCDIVDTEYNTIIYGHNMRDGTMFGSLKRYIDEDYYKAHRTISFSTLYEDREYEIIAVGLSEVGYNDEEEFKYYDFIDASSDKDFTEFKRYISAKSLYPVETDITKFDQLLTLSTCNSYTEDGRLFIVARRTK